MILKLDNELMFAEYNPDSKEIYMGDKTDQNNDPREYTTTKRGIEKAWNELEKVFTENTKMFHASKLLNNYGIGTHYYCAID